MASVKASRVKFVAHLLQEFKLKVGGCSSCAYISEPGNVFKNSTLIWWSFVNPQLLSSVPISWGGGVGGWGGVWNSRGVENVTKI